MKHSLLHLLAGLFLLAGAANAVEADFSKDAPENLFEGAAVAPQGDGAISLPARLETRAFPVEASKKYRLEITAKVDGPFVVEDNERAHILTLQTHLHRLTATYQVVFLDSKGMEIKGENLRGFFLSNQRRQYTFVFCTPENAASVRVCFESNGKAAQIASFKLVEEADEGTINPNPDFRYGELSYSGWQPTRNGRLYTRPDGKTVFEAGYGGASPLFPLNESKKYRVSAVGKGGSINIQYYDKEGKMFQGRFLMRPAETGAETELTPPPGTKRGRIVMFKGVILESFKVVEAK